MLCLKRAAKTYDYPVCCRLAVARQHYLDTTTIFWVWRVEHREAREWQQQVVALTESKPRIVYVGERGSPLSGMSDGKRHAFYMLQLHFKNRPRQRVGERSTARKVSATIEFWEEHRNTPIVSFEGRWPVTGAGEHVGYERTERTVDFEANEIPVKLNLVLIPFGENGDGRVYAAAEENFYAYQAGTHPAFRINSFQDTDVVRVCIKLRSSIVEQDFQFKLRWYRSVDPQSGHRCFEVTPLSGEVEDEYQSVRFS